jgi:hypothetical protein
MVAGCVKRNDSARHEAELLSVTIIVAASLHAVDPADLNPDADTDLNPDADRCIGTEAPTTMGTINLLNVRIRNTGSDRKI